MKEKIILIGGGGHCKSCIDIIEEENNFKIAGIIDIKDKIGQNILGYPIVGSDENLEGLTKLYKYYFITIGQIKSPEKRINLFESIRKLGGKFPVMVSPRAYISKHAKIGEGTIIMHNAVVNVGAKIGKNCIINTGSIIEHDVIIEDHCHISTGATVNGGTVVRNGSFLGSNAVTKEYVVIKENSFIKANTLVKK